MEPKEYNYLAVFLGNTDGVREDVEAVSVGDKIAWAESKNVTICTFISVLKYQELTQHFGVEDNSINRNFFIMQVDEASIYFSNEMIKERLMDAFDLIGNPEKDYDLEGMTEDEKVLLIDNILDKGENITPYDQKLLELLSKT